MFTLDGCQFYKYDSSTTLPLITFPRPPSPPFSSSSSSSSTSSSKWEQHFKDISEGKVIPNHKGRYIVGSGSRKAANRHEDYFKIELVTPIEHVVKIAESELKRKSEIIREDHQLTLPRRKKLKNE